MELRDELVGIDPALADALDEEMAESIRSLQMDIWGVDYAERPGSEGFDID